MGWIPCCELLKAMPQYPVAGLHGEQSCTASCSDFDLLCRCDDCFFRLLDGMLQVVGFTDKSLQDNMLKIPTRIRSITINHPEGSSLAALPCMTERVLGTVSTPLASIQGLELSAAPRQAEPAGTRCKP